MLQVWYQSLGPSIRCVRTNAPRSGPSAGFGRVGPWITDPGAVRSAASTASSQPGCASQSSSVNATRRPAPARHAALRAVAGPSERASGTARSRSVERSPRSASSASVSGSGPSTATTHLEGSGASV